MKSKYCPNCDDIKEVVEEVNDTETIRQCLTCGITWSFTNNESGN